MRDAITGTGNVGLMKEEGNRPKSGKSGTFYYEFAIQFLGRERRAAKCVKHIPQCTRPTVSPCCDDIMRLKDKVLASLHFKYAELLTMERTASNLFAILPRYSGQQTKMPSFKIDKEVAVTDRELSVKRKGIMFTGPAHSLRFHPIQPEVSIF